MKLWLVKPRHPDNKVGPWSPWYGYDKAFGFVVRAESERQARELATTDAGDETDHAPDCWLSSEFSICEELTPDGEAGVVLRDFHAS